MREVALQEEGGVMSRSALAKAYLDRVASVGCVLCRHVGLPVAQANVHHLREGQGLSQRAPDWLAIALCREHHQGTTGWHGLGQGGFYRKYKLDELDLLAMTIEAVEKARNEC